MSNSAKVKLIQQLTTISISLYTNSSSNSVLLERRIGIILEAVIN